MRRAPVILPALLLLALVVGCGTDDGDDDDGDNGSRNATALSACGRLTEAHVEQLTGVPVTRKSTSLDDGGATCAFTRKGAETAESVLYVAAAPTPRDLDAVVDLLVGGNEHTTEPLEVDGAEDAVVLEDTSNGISSRSAVAVTEDGWYSVEPFGGSTREDEVRIAAGALTALLGGEVPAESLAPTRRAPHPCQVLEATEVSRVLGTSLGASRNDGVEGLRQCLYESPSPEPSVTLSDFADRVPVDAAVAPAENAGATVDEVTGPGISEAYVVVRDELPDRATAWLATPAATYQLEVQAGTSRESAAIARTLVLSVGAAS